MTGPLPAAERAEAIVSQVLTLLDSEGRTQAVESLRAQRDAKRSSHPTIVVAGEDKRGKSSLVNALLASPDLSPVGAKVVTGSPVRFFHARTPSAEITRYGSSVTEPVEPETARLLATVDGNPGNEQNISSVAIGADIDLLEVLDIVDTPGVGGLTSGHAALTLQSLHSADALLFVVDAAAPLRAAELAFLRKAASRLQAVILVVTKTDIHPGWRQILDDDLAVLAEQAPRFAGCPAAGVSSTSALRALSMDDPAFAREIRIESGIDGLEELLREQVAGAVDSIRLQNLLRAAIGRLAVLERDLKERWDATGADEQNLAGLNAQAAELELLRQDKVEWPGRLDAEIRKLTLTREDVSSRRLLAIRHRYEEQLLRASTEEIKAMPGEVLAELTALAGELNELAAERLAEITSALLDDLDQRVSLKQGIEQIGLAGLDQTGLPSTVTGRPMAHGERMAMLSELGRGRSLLGLASGSSALAFLAPPFGIVIGLGLGGLFAFQAWRDHTQRGQAANLRVWLQEQVNSAQLTIRNGFAMQVVDLQREIKATVRATLADRERQLKRSIDEVAAVRKQGAADRAQTRRRLERRSDAARSLRREATAALRDLGAADV